MNSTQTIIIDALRKTEHNQRRSGQQRQRNPAWPQAYAAYLLSETKFSTGSERLWQANELAQALIDLDTAYQRALPKQSWAEYVAERLIS